MQVKSRQDDTPPYTALAKGYDFVMEHVDYVRWAEYVYDLIKDNHAAPRTILELGCGTGSLALELQPLGNFAYLATDGSPQMVRIARKKAEAVAAEVTFKVADFTAFGVEETVDVAILLYDGLNYLLTEDAIRDVLWNVYRVLSQGGLFLFDQSTPANSLNNAAHFEDKGREQGFSYVRNSRYDPNTRLHTTVFKLIEGPRRYKEEHVQRAYELSQIRALIQEMPFEEVGAFDGFSTKPATEATERVHWLVRRR